jgi:hypothetical protein
MADETLNDNEKPNSGAHGHDGARHDGAGHDGDAHGRAALLLVESLVHCLIERSLITVEDAVEILATASEVEAEAADDAGDPRMNNNTSLSLLEAIKTSLSHDIGSA